MLGLRVAYIANPLVRLVEIKTRSLICAAVFTISAFMCVINMNTCASAALLMLSKPLIRCQVKENLRLMYLSIIKAYHLFHNNKHVM